MAIFSTFWPASRSLSIESHKYSNVSLCVLYDFRIIRSPHAAHHEIDIFLCNDYDNVLLQQLK